MHKVPEFSSAAIIGCLLQGVSEITRGYDPCRLRAKVRWVWASVSSFHRFWHSESFAKHGFGA